MAPPIFTLVQTVLDTLIILLFFLTYNDFSRVSKLSDSERKKYAQPRPSNEKSYFILAGIFFLTVMFSGLSGIKETYPDLIEGFFTAFLIALYLGEVEWIKDLTHIVEKIEAETQIGVK